MPVMATPKHANTISIQQKARRLQWNSTDEWMDQGLALILSSPEEGFDSPPSQCKNAVTRGFLTPLTEELSKVNGARPL